MRIHFIGIGGIGVSALAQYYLAKGHKVSGSDLASSEITDLLKSKGVKISIGKNKVPENTDFVIYSPAVKIKNLKLKIPALSYPEALGGLTKKYFTIAVSGTHGKSTTTSMLGLLLLKAGLDPTVIVGTKIKEFGNTNYRAGKSKYLIIEADEHFASFLNYWPKIIVLTSIEADHLDFYKNLNNLVKTFKKYIKRLPKDGILVANKDDKNIQKLIEGNRISLKCYSGEQKEARKLKKILKVPGDHNVSNALAALTAARALGVPDKISYKALSEYKGSWRRFEMKKVGSYSIISDYAHHPTEIRVTLKAVREKYPKKKIWCVYQPHQYQRTYYLFADFIKTFRKAPIDKIILTDIYDVAGRENKQIKKKVSSEKLVKAINKKNVVYLPKNEIADCVKKDFPKNGMLIIMGAGDIYKIISNF